MHAAFEPLPQAVPEPALHIMCERDVGLFSLVQQVIANIPWAFADGRIPVAYFGRHCSYWTPGGHRGGDNVWEYYFEPIIPEVPATRIPLVLRASLDDIALDEQELGICLDAGHFVTRHFGDHPALAGKSMCIPYLWDDPRPDLRRQAAEVIRRYVRPRSYIEAAVAAFRAEHLPDPFIGVHVRGTDAISKSEVRAHRKGSLSFRHYEKAIRQALNRWPEARLFIATDSQRSLDTLRVRFGARVVAYDSLRHVEGNPVGHGPRGNLMPSYVTREPELGVRNGEEAVIEYRLLCESALLIHNGSGLARTALLTRPELPHVNTHLSRLCWVFAVRNAQRGVQLGRRLKGRFVTRGNR